MRYLTPPEMVRALSLLAGDKEWRKELRATYRPAANLAAGFFRTTLRASGNRQLVAAARGVRGSSNTTSGSVRASGRVRTSSGKPMPATAPIWGTKGPTGWLAKIKDTAARNNLPWVGSNWTVGTKGEGPRGNDGIAAGEQQILTLFEQSAMRTLARHFPLT